ncbi:MAG TPA: polysaccharide biosynthesis/export family protein [Usitatibacter sp.]|nr:polysaccharide biosynthesis/export family protein [Usitatibacter sp.]
MAFAVPRALRAGWVWMLCAGAVAAFADEPANGFDGMNLPLKMSPALNESSPGTPAGHVAVQAPLPITPRLGDNKDYRIGPDDLLEIQVFGVDQLSRTVRVNGNGFISLPLVGSVAVGGLTAHEAELAVAKKLATDYLQDPQVSLFVKEYTTQRITVEGAVAKPGIYPLRGETTLLRALALAGGQGSLSDMSQVMLFRSGKDGTRMTLTYDVERIRHGEIEDPLVQNDDLIVLNRSPVRVLLRDSVLRDALDAVNPLSPILPK